MYEIKSFSRKQDLIQPPNLVEAQILSYNWLLKHGLKELFAEISPIKDLSDRGLELYFLDYSFEEAKFDQRTSQLKNVTYEASLRVNTRLIDRNRNETIDQEVYLGDIPLMTDRGTFIINGIERVVTFQLVRSSGILFTANLHKGKRLYGAKLVPSRGSWLEFETDINGVIWIRIDRKRKIAATSFLRFVGYSTDEEIKELFKDIDISPNVSYINATLKKDDAHNEEEGLLDIYRRVRPGDFATIDNARSLLNAMFFRFDRYDLGVVGRHKFNKRLKLSVQQDITQKDRILQKTDIVYILQEIIRLNIAQAEPDDIDHLSNRRVRGVGELLAMKLRVGLARMTRIVRDRMSTLEAESINARRLINVKPLMSMVGSFFMSFQLSQFMDQINPLSELEHQRRLSAMGPGGLSKERAGFEVRDVHSSHYSRICPVATPEGPNIGLVTHLATYARINDYGFIEAPYRKVIHITDKNGEARAKATDEIQYLEAFEEEQYVICPATADITSDGYFINDIVEARRHGEAAMTNNKEVDFMEVSSSQIISVSTALIPFVEHDDAVRALMGTNMQRQAIPLLKPEAPLIGTSMEPIAARDSGYLAITKHAGTVVELDSSHVKIMTTDRETDTYIFNKFLRSNASTCINQKPLTSLNLGDKVKVGQVLSDTHATSDGVLSLGHNLLVAFMSFDGYNYEDAIIISRKVVEEDKLTSIHLATYVADVRDTRLGPEIVTFDIPNVSEEKLKDLDENGIIRIGAIVSAGDILVGKITPKGEVELSPEERLLRAIFGDKSKDVKDSSLYLEYGEYGKVVGTKIFSRDAGDKLPSGIIKSIHITVSHMRKIQVGDKLAGRHGNKGVISKILAPEDMPCLEDGTPIDIILSPLGVISRMNLGQILETHLGFAAKKLGYRAVIPPFTRLKEEELKAELLKAGLPADGKVKLYDGRTGESFDNPITVGYIYMLKLNHMVDDKIHQRSIGPYSLVTQQPLGGRARFGGQRFGEMEVWALEGHGAAYTLQEILTIKSDDVVGRQLAYEAIIKGEKIKIVNIPEVFNVLVHELKGLGLDIEMKE